MFEKLKENKQLWLNSLSIFIVGVGLLFIYFILKNVGLITEEKIKTGGKRFKTWGLLFYFGYSIICVYVINGAREFLPAFMQFLGILLIMGVFDRIVVDAHAR